jgi:tetraacyldisaccharide 4'-kinase
MPSEKLSTLKTRATSWLLNLWHASQGPSLLNPIHAGLWVASGGYRLGLALDQWTKLRKKRKLPAFVVSVGNLVVGGTGKTPFTLWLAETVRNAGLSVAILSRGYGRQTDHVARVSAANEDWEGATKIYGDEPVLLARRLPSVPVWVGRNRFAAGEQAIKRDAPSVLILDDGFQHLSLHRDLDFVLLDAERPFGNGRLLPLGPLREPIHHLSRADALLLTRAKDGHAAARMRAKRGKAFPEKPVFACSHKLTGLASGVGRSLVPSGELQGKAAVAFAGIARPESFFESLRAAETGLHLVETMAFPDHHAYTVGDGDRLLDHMRMHGAHVLVTTEKDWVRLPAALRAHVLTATLELDFGADPGLLMDYLMARIGAFRSH